MSIVVWPRIVAAVGLLTFIASAPAQTSPAVKLTVDSTTPRAVEPLTEHSIVRDYAAAWKALTEASEEESPAPLDAHFVGAANALLRRRITGQQGSGLTMRYLNQVHNLKAVFYAPEGDVMELQDAAEYQLQILSGGKVIHEEHVVIQYAVLMTPAADRWMVRQLQSIPAM